jgi:ABC-type transport system involved in multi-copper enzyme maturation permease subunit
VIGLFQAELLRLRRRRSLQVIVLAVPFLVGVIFVLGYNSVQEQPAFDPAAYRQELIDSGFALGMPPEELEPLLAEAIEARRQEMAQVEESQRLTRATYVFPYSLVQVLGSGTFVLLALILLTATTIGDEFGWATIRTALIASSRRRAFLLVRVLTVVGAGVLIFALLLALAALLPLVLNVPRDKLPATLPQFDAGAFLVLIGGELVASVMVVGFAALITLLLRNGGLTLVSVLIWVAIEAAVLTLLVRFPSFGQGEPPPDAWLLEAFPLRGMTTLIGRTGLAATGLPRYLGDVVSRDVGFATVPIVSFAILAALFYAFAFRRFSRMDIVE